MKKRYICLFIVLLFFIKCNSVLAIVVTSHPIKNMMIDNIRLNDGVKYQKDPANGYASDVYCGAELKKFVAGSNFSEDTSFRDSKGCSYEYNGKTISGADCSEILAYVITSGRELAPGDSDHKWGYTQMAVWAYLADYAPAQFGANNQSWKRLPTLNKILKDAFKKYHEFSKNSSAICPTDDNIITFNGDKTFYFEPNDSGCGGGHYITNKIKITNIKNTRIKIKLETNKTDSSVKICKSSTECSVNKEVELLSGQSYEFYLKSTNETNVDDTKVLVHTTVPNVVTNKKDSSRWLSGDNQPIIAYGTFDNDCTASKDYEFSIAVKKVTHKTCDDYPNDKINEDNTYGANVSVNKSCVNSLITAGGTKRPPSKDKYEANYANCECTTIDVGGGSKVNVRIYENVTFRFGILNPVLAFPGGGIRFAKKGESITTDYISNVTWRYVDYNADGSPYYYNPNNFSDNSVSDDLHNQINSKVRDMISDKLDLTFGTVDSNSGDTTNVTISNSLNRTESNQVVDGKTYIVFTSKTSGSGISMNHAYFSIDGKVSYESLSNYPIDGGNNYYIPIKYGNSKFPFNISDEINLSVLKNGGYKFIYKAVCEVEVGSDPDNPNDPCVGDDCDPKFLDKAINYRSIDLNNPFPKANASTGEGIKENWKDWYTDSSANKQRIKDTFNNYPNQPLYSINMNNELLSRIGNIDSFYTSWSNVETTGFDKFLSDYGVNYSRADHSYCEINQFKSDCDR